MARLWKGCICGILIHFGLLQLTAKAQSIDPLPEAPYYYVFDERKSLDSSTNHALQSLLIEHNRLTGQKIVIAVFDKLPLPDSDLSQVSHLIFQKWRVGQGDGNSGILWVVDTTHKQIKIEIDYKIESILSNEKIQGLISDLILPAIKAEHLNAALIQGTYHLLEMLDSPLINSGKAIEIINQNGAQNQLYNSSSPVPRSWGVLFLGGILILASVISMLLSREAHFTSEGWFIMRWKINLKQEFEFFTQPKNNSRGGISGSW